MNAAAVHRRRLGNELRRIRRTSGRTIAQVAAQAGWPTHKLSRIEHGRTGIGAGELRLLLDAHHVQGPARDALLALQAPTSRGWAHDYGDVAGGTFAAYLAMETQARAALTFSLAAVPGLLQHQSYAHCVLDSGQAIGVATPHQVARRLELRLHRQQRLRQTDAQADPPAAPLRLAAVIDESTLWRAVGDPTVMESQMTHLLEQAELPNVDIRILPLEMARRPVFGESFTVLEFAGELGLTDIAYLDGLASPELYLGDGAQLYRKSWNAMKDYALPPAESKQFIEHAVGKWRLR
ncbi:helix-turn-helix domain-containing protein [Actinomadura violacea]|uniref:Helix-turn-helix domain-containing protein n=1 Tax=Actinomadura violacea TaxID=2819934 RepID=A0ABS3RXM9_9ACTN|nr:helix-turn-helix transcriptional regulator [Actinomadura violacea]MBO2461519.1 helix-turn-helix domain-containing protein [Actinomadura violacea]